VLLSLDLVLKLEPFRTTFSDLERKLYCNLKVKVIFYLRIPFIEVFFQEVDSVPLALPYNNKTTAPEATPSLTFLPLFFTQPP
jgi:hypothetical protein